MGLMDEYGELCEDRKSEARLASEEHWGDYIANLPSIVRTWMNRWPNVQAERLYLRASGLYFLCPREFILNYWNPKDNVSFDAVSHSRMALGHFLHEYLQDRLLGPMGVLYGEWSNGKETVKGFHPDYLTALAENANYRPLTWHYKEPSAFSPELRISGHIDGFIDMDRIQELHAKRVRFEEDPSYWCSRLEGEKIGRASLLEVKSTGSYLFQNKLKTPEDIPEYYCMQAEIYQALTKVWETVFWFVDRDTLGAKIFPYRFEGKWWRDAKRKAKIVWKGIREKTLPETAMACKSPKDARSKKCVHSKECWKCYDEFKRFAKMVGKWEEELGEEFPLVSKDELEKTKVEI